MSDLDFYDRGRPLDAQDQEVLTRAVDCYSAVQSQVGMITSHLERLSIQLVRYQPGSWEYCIKILEMQKWLDMTMLLKAMYDGKVVQPS